ncbi:hypothetical protein AMJ51_00060 [Microgenomates bacterium DG_75]|nr:MAG: hypothetical protein AMJ51_00060 [Microgenomates bacterium DG_75]
MIADFLDIVLPPPKVVGKIVSKDELSLDKTAQIVSLGGKVVLSSSQVGVKFLPPKTLFETKEQKKVK